MIQMWYQVSLQVIFIQSSQISTIQVIVHCGKYSMKFIEPELDIHDPVSIALGATLDEPIKSKKTTTPYHIPDHDLKVTLRVMPALKHYTGTVQHHIGSRSWGGNHDGLSYWVEHVEKLKVCLYMYLRIEYAWLINDYFREEMRNQEEDMVSKPT